MAIILPANTLSGAYEVANSCRFNDGDSAYMHKTPGSEGAREKWTFSCWIKKATNGIRQHIMTSYYNASNFCTINFESDDQLNFYDYNGGSVNGKRHTTRVFRDNSAWYNIVCVWDTTNGTTEDKIRIYVNGVRETVFDTNSAASDNDSRMNHTLPIRIGAYDASSYYFDGYISEVVFIDNLALDATSFGEFDEDSPTIWKPIDVSGLTFGTNGFYLDFEDSANLGNDANGGTDLTEVNLAAADQATDTPTNSFATMNPLIPGVSNITYSEGNLIMTQTTAAWVKSNSTLGMSNGKWYWEAKWIGDNSGTGSWMVLGVDNTDTATPYPTSSTTAVGWKKNGDLDLATVAQTDIATYAEGDVLSVALDMDNDAVYFRKNGASWENSGDPTSGSDKTGAYSLPVANSTYFATISPYDTSIAGMNFGGCPSFAISSGNADADGYGNFEYAVPTGYYALCTKNLAEYG